MTSTNTVALAIPSRRVEPRFGRPYTCPRCKSNRISLSQINTDWERLIVRSGVKIVRCHQCQTRSAWF